MPEKLARSVVVTPCCRHHSLTERPLLRHSWICAAHSCSSARCFNSALVILTSHNTTVAKPFATFRYYCLMCVYARLGLTVTSPPPREDCAYLLDPGEVHDGPPRRTHSIGDLIQRKNKSHFQNCSEILYNVQTIKKSIGYPKHKYNFYWIFSAYRNSLDLRWHRSKTQHPSSVGADIR